MARAFQSGILGRGLSYREACAKYRNAYTIRILGLYSKHEG